MMNQSEAIWGDWIGQKMDGEIPDDETYEEFLARKTRRHLPTGLADIPELHNDLFEWQRDIVAWALRKGRACMFEDCGLGKTFQQLEWARCVPGDVLILTPLAVSHQTEREAERWGIDAKVSRDGSKAGPITITNYERLHRFDVSDYVGLVLDESSILKSHDGKTRTTIIDAAQSVPYRLACTATPAPNDHMELANHCEFVGAMTRSEMLATYFVHDGSSTQSWRLKGHAVDDFWRWVATWAVWVRTPEDIGYANDGFDLPPLNVHEHVIVTNITEDGELLPLPAMSLNDQRRARRQTISDRVSQVADIVNGSDEPWVIWCELNDEGNALASMIDGAVQVAGADSDEAKSQRLNGFVMGEFNVLVTKPKIGGFGMNWQHCSNMAFVGLSHSWEQFYQAVRRCWRFGQEKPVDVHIIATDRNLAVLENIKRKQEQADEAAAQTVAAMEDTMKTELQSVQPIQIPDYAVETRLGRGWTMHLGDCVEHIKGIGDESIHYTIFSPPFASLYTYSNSPRDMGNCTNDGEFIDHFRYLIGELFRVTMNGRLLSFHCMNLPTTKSRDGFIGIRDFRGELIRMFVAAGWIFHSEVVIWKDPVTAMQRTKALGLLHKQIRKDSTMCRQGIPDYLVTMRKPGDNPERVGHTREEFPVSLWQRYASPVWHDINPSDTLQYRSAREHEDEKHICPLQLNVIRRAIMLWTNPGDLVFSPFAGIGSEGYVALQNERKFLGIELKQSYFGQACKNLDAATAQLRLL